MDDVVIAVAVLAGGAAGAGAGWTGRRWLCRARRGVRPPALWCEGAVAVLWVVLLVRASSGVLPWWWLPVPLWLAWLAVLLSACDLAARRLPDALTLSAYPVVALLLGVAAWWGRTPLLLGGALVGAVLHAGTYLLVRAVSVRAMGAGDVKLAGTLGAVVGAVSLPAVALSMFAAAVITLAFAPRCRVSGVPHGPAMLVPAWLLVAFPVVSGG